MSAVSGGQTQRREMLDATMTVRWRPARPDALLARRFPSMRFLVAAVLLAATVVAGALVVSAPVAGEPSLLQPHNHGGGGHRPLISDLRSVSYL